MDATSDQNTIELEADLAHNPALLGMEADRQAGRFSYGTFADFVSKQTEYIPTPRRPNTPICYEENALKKRVFAQVKVIFLAITSGIPTELAEEKFILEHASDGFVSPVFSNQYRILTS